MPTKPEGVLTKAETATLYIADLETRLANAVEMYNNTLASNDDYRDVNLEMWNKTRMDIEKELAFWRSELEN